jgi:hypothetical protein
LLTACGLNEASQSDLPAVVSATGVGTSVGTSIARIPTTVYPTYIFTYTHRVSDPNEKWARETAIATWDAGARTPPPWPTVTAQAAAIETELSGIALTPYSTPIHRVIPTPAGAGRILNSKSRGLGEPPVRNSWVAEIGSVVIEVAAGWSREDETQGLLAIRERNTQTGEGQGLEIFLSPTNSGALEVVDAAGQVLTLAAEDGTIFYFDVQSRQWVSAPTASPSPAISPLPSLTP